jgi:Pectate lyase superfamily protein/Right handed beta helix region
MNLRTGAVNILRAFMLAVLVFFGIALIGQRLIAQAPYDLPNDDSGCPANCRQIPWQAGSDLWNSGSLPSYTSVTCTGLAGNGTTNDGPAIQTCINAASANTAVFIPAGTYLVNSTVRLKSNVVLRGAGPSSTFLNEGASGWLTTQNFSFGAQLDPPTTYATNTPGYALSGTPKKGDTTLTVSTGTVNVGDWIAVFANDDPTLVTATGTNGVCRWCADNTGYHLMQQIVQVTAKSGSTITISRPLYYTLYTSPQYRKYMFPTQKAGFESFKVTATGDIGAGQIITLQGCLFCWVSGVETQNTGSSSGSAHIELMESYGCEVRDSYLHDGRSSASGANYGVYLLFVNSDHKVENNIMRHNRHGIVYQGGGSGTAILYNYVDDNYTDDLSYLGSARTSHGAHPYMNLFEGNVISHIAADDFWGSSSHFVFFRNWLWGDETGTGVPSFPPINGFGAIDLYTMQTYYSLVGNVLGVTGKQATWPTATLRGFNEYASPSAPIVYSRGGASGSIPGSDTTLLNHGNYDYKTNGVAYWEGGSNHTLKTSMYYSAQPSFLANCSWPSFGPEGSPTTNQTPAVARYNGTACNGGGSPPPTNLKGSVH